MANITDVAKLAGVSHQTVSRVLNDISVRPATRARVDAAIRELNYRPSSAARALVTRKSNAIGLIATGAPLYGPSSTMLAFNEAARAAGYQVTIASMTSVDREAMVSTVEVLLGQRVEALVLIVADVAAFDAIAGLDIDVPLVTAESSGREGFLSVSIDQFAGARLAVRHLVGLGHRSILHVKGPDWSVDAAERERGWRVELESSGLPVAPPLEGTWLAASGYAIGTELTRTGAVGGAGATAIFSANDQMAIGLLHALSDAGLRVPGDVSVVGFDDIPESEHFSPPLTTVRQDFADLGARMMETLLQVLDGRPPLEPVHTTPELVVRSSTGAPIPLPNREVNA
jgi:DNA-binding LacI/PurR family transcriptional regulator